MREILFRGKRVDNGEWVYGYYTELPEGDIGATLMVGSDELLCEDTAAYIVSIETKQCPSFSPAYPIQVFDADLCKVCPETVGEYTGLTDNNGRKIFEGDIVRDCDGRIYEIKHFDFEWIAEQTRAFWINIKHLKPCEIIGNVFDYKNKIHDNPELLQEDMK